MREGRGWTVFWGALAALGTGAWLVGIGGLGLTASHSGLASAEDWTELGVALAVGSAFASAAAALFLRSLGEPARRALRRSVRGALAALGAFQILLVLSVRRELPAGAAALALAAGALPAAIALAARVARAAPAPRP